MDVIPLAEPGTPLSDELLCRMMTLGLCCCPRADRCGVSSRGEISAVLAVLSASVITGDQQENVAARVAIITTGRQSPTHDLSSIVDVERFYQLQT